MISRSSSLASSTPATSSNVTPVSRSTYTSAFQLLDQFRILYLHGGENSGSLGLGVLRNAADKRWPQRDFLQPALAHHGLEFDVGNLLHLRHRQDEREQNPHQHRQGKDHPGRLAEERGKGRQALLFQGHGIFPGISPNGGGASASAIEISL